MRSLDFAKPASNQRKRFLPASFAKTITLSYQRLLQPAFEIHKVPAKLAFHAGRNIVRRALAWLDLQDVTVLGPDVERAPNTTIRAYCLGDLGTDMAHRRFRFGQLQDRPIADLWLDVLHQIDHS